jgi:hypothetical protein
MFAKILIGFTTFLFTTTQLLAGPLVKIDSPPLALAQASLVIQSPNGDEITYSPQELEGFQTYRLSTTTPWREDPADFEGILLTDLLAEHGLSDVVSITVTAENDYQTVITKEVWDSVPFLVATRVNGRPHNRRERGPIQFVADADAFNASDVTSDSNLVWMAARIEAND